MKCPVCKKRLILVNYAQPGEYICSNEDCSGNNDVGIYQEYYGTTQDAINTQGE